MVDIEKTEPIKEELLFFVTEILEGRSLGKTDEAARDALRFALEIVESIQQSAKQYV